MNKMVELLKNIKDKYNYLYQLAKKTETYMKERSLCNTVFNYFHILKPLTYKYIETDIDGLAIGKWIRIKYSYHKYGEILDKYQATRFVQKIREHGDKLIPYIRESIREDFARLVELTKKLILYGEREFRIIIDNFHYISLDKGINIRETHKATLSFNTNNPLWLEIKFDGKLINLSILDYAAVLNLYDIIDDLIKLYKDAYKFVLAAEEHNKIMLEEMRKVVMPHLLTINVKE